MTTAKSSKTNFARIAGTTLALAVTLGFGAPASIAATSGYTVPNASAIDDSAAGFSRTNITIPNIFANDTPSVQKDAMGNVISQATWVAGKTILIDMTDANNKATVDANGQAVLTTKVGVVTATVDPSNPAVMSATFVSIKGYEGEPPVSYFATDTANATAQAALKFTVTKPGPGAVLGNATAADDVIKAVNGVGSIDDVFANDTASVKKDLSGNVISQATWDTGKTFLIDGSGNKAYFVDGIATITTAEGVTSATINGSKVGASFDGKGNTAVAPTVSYFGIDTYGATAQARILVEMTEPNEVPAEEDLRESTPETSTIGETPAPETSTVKEEPAPETSTIKTTEGEPSISLSGDLTPTATNGDGFPDDLGNTAATAATAPVKEGGVSLADILVAGLGFLGFTGAVIALERRRNRKKTA